MPLSHLPLEVLQLVLNVLKDRGDRSSLNHMLRVNRFFYEATVPYVYEDGLGLLQPRNQHSSATHKLEQLLQTILRQLPPEDVGPLLSAAYNVHLDSVETAKTGSTIVQSNNGQLKDAKQDSVQLGQGDHTPAPQTTSMQRIDYLSHVRVFYFEQAVFKPFYKNKTIDHQRTRSNKSLTDFAFKTRSGGSAYGIGDGAYDDKLVFRPCAGSRDSVSTLRYGAVSMAIRRQLTWLLCSRSFEKVRTLAIPLSDVDQYLSKVERFPCLSYITFIMDEYLDVHNMTLASVTAETAKASADCRDRRNQQFRSMLLFVQRHGQLFPNVLQYVDCPDSWAWPSPTRCPKVTQDKLQNVLPPFANLTSVHEMNYYRLSTKIKLTDLGSVTSVVLADNLHLRTLLAADPTFWSRCRGLKTIFIRSPNPGCFRWAVEQKVARTRDTMSAPPARVSTVNMRSFSMQVDELNDIVEGFGDTLSNLKVTLDHQNLERRAGMGYDFHFGRRWSLPKVQSLNITVVGFYTQLVMDRDLLFGLGKDIKSLCFIDESNHLPLERSKTYRIPTEALPNLEDLTLGGGTASQFHPGTLYFTPNLKTLRLYLNNMAPSSHLQILSHQYGVTYNVKKATLHSTFESGSDPSTTVHGQVLWTWDWYLPKLHTLSLKDEFAFMFQFRMLAGCPSLVSLTLDIYGHVPTTERALTLQDFELLPSSTCRTSDPVDHEGQAPLVSAPSLQRLLMVGRWVLSDEIVEVLSGAVFPNLTHWRMKEAIGFTLVGCVSALRHRPLLKEVDCWAMGSAQELESLGLVLQNDIPLTFEGPSFWLRKGVWGFLSNASDIERVEDKN
ncbi:hypothetical protein EMPS_07292 [Entomortierella parvispora]|uniref:Uncharacterized protein n=1 Tax=Entomortierella parvispora TaxID=205924 RepID=A0A9P3LY81_9FUNG|nr:hypothetical protein EMPS_07292 [Entomortierella parvispora]